MKKIVQIFRYRVTVIVRNEGRFQTTRCAKHPIEAGNAVLRSLGFNENDAHHPPVAMFVVPLGGAS